MALLVNDNSEDEISDSTDEPNIEMEFDGFIDFKLEEEQAYIDSSDDENIIIQDQKNEFSINILTDEERKIVDMCTEVELKELLLLNRAKNFRLNRLYLNMNNLLKVCRQNIQANKVSMSRSLLLQPSKRFSHQWKLGTPYFKDFDFFSSPPNNDTKQKYATNELKFEALKIDRWRKLECDNLIQMVKLFYNLGKQNNIMKRIEKLKAKMDNTKDNVEQLVIIDEIIECENRIEELNKNVRHVDIPSLSADKLIDWERLSSQFNNGRRDANECRVIWHIYLHPEINKSSWNKVENKKLKELAQIHNYQNWDLIANELNSNRSGFLTCLHYYRDLHENFCKTRFTPYEDGQLIYLVNCYREGDTIPWHKISYFIPTRSRIQLYRRYVDVLSKPEKKRGRFSQAEDILLMILVHKFGKNWRKCMNYFPNRSQIQIKHRYILNLEKMMKKGSFSVDDDAMILEHVENFGESNWGILGKKLKRTRVTVRQRYLVMKNFIKSNPDWCLENLPKRRHKFLETKSGNYHFTQYVADKFKNNETIPTLETIEEYLKTLDEPTLIPNRQITKPKKSINTYKKNIDHLLTEHFSNSFKTKPNKILTDYNLDIAANYVVQILKILGAKLKVPNYLQEDTKLDDIDRIILSKILEAENIDQSINTLVPPNFHTILGLKNLLLWKSKESKNVNSIQKFQNVDDDSKDADLFKRRFNSIFKWSSLLTLETPKYKDGEEEPCQSSKKQNFDHSVLSKTDYLENLPGTSSECS